MVISAILTAISMLVAFVILRSLLKVPLPLVFILAAIVGALVGGFGIPLRHLVEGMYGYFHIVLVLVAAFILISVVRKSGTLDVITRDVLVHFHNKPVSLLLLIIAILFVPGLFTGFGGVAVLTSGVIVAPILLRVGIPKVETAAIIALGAIFGMVAPPVNLPAFIIALGTNMPWVGFTLTLLVLSIPLAVFSVFFVGLPSYKSLSLNKVLEGLPNVKGSLKQYVPFIVIVLWWILIRAIPEYVPDPSNALILIVGALIATVTGTKRVNFFKASKEGVKEPVLTLAVVLIGVAMIVQVMALTGVRGLLISASMSLRPPWTYLAIVISMPFLGGILTSLGSADILGLPFAYAFIERNMIVNVSALSLIACLSELFLPTAICGILSASVVKENNYLRVWRRCWIPIVVTAAVGILMIVFSVLVGRVLT